MTPEQIGSPASASRTIGHMKERQRQPGRLRRTVEPAGDAVHALEHLASTDRGVLMLRKIVRDGIRAVAAAAIRRSCCASRGRPSPPPARTGLLRIPPEKDAEADKQLLRETGRKVARGGLAEARA